METKRCSKCGEIKNIETGFYRHKDGYVRGVCRQCHNKDRIEYKKKHPDLRHKWSQTYRKKNKDMLNAKNRAKKKRYIEQNRCPSCSAPLCEEDIVAGFKRCQNCREKIHKPLKPIWAKQLREDFLNADFNGKSSK